MEHIRELIDKAIVRFGSEAALARASGVSQPVVHEARKNGRVGPKLAMGLEKAMDGEISRSDLRPDLWPTPSSEHGAAA